MREIKFRAKGIEDNKWYIGYFISIQESDASFTVIGNIHDNPELLSHGS